MTSANRPSLERYTLAGEVTGEKAKRTRYGERGHLLSEEGKDSGVSALSARVNRGLDQRLRIFGR